MGFVIADVCMKTGLVPSTPHLLYPIAVLAANAPDLDVLFVGLKMKRNHRLNIMHFPAMWVLVLGLAYLFLDITAHTAIFFYFTVVALGVFSHFLLDTFDSNTGILWLAPVSKKAYCFLRRNAVIPATFREHVKSYVHHPVMLAESAVWLIALYVLVK